MLNWLDISLFSLLHNKHVQMLLKHISIHLHTFVSVWFFHYWIFSISSLYNITPVTTCAVKYCMAYNQRPRKLWKSGTVGAHRGRTEQSGGWNLLHFGDSRSSKVGCQVSSTSLVPTYDIISHFVLNDYGKTVWICHRVSITTPSRRVSKNCANLFFVTTLSSFYRLWKFLA